MIGPVALARRGLRLAGGGLGAGRATAAAAAADLVRSRPDDPLAERDPGYIRATLPAYRAITDLYFRPRVRGLERIPAEGPVLLVGNHSGGTLIADTFVFAYAFYEHFGADRPFHQLAHDLAVSLPAISAPLRRYGTVPASHENARRALDGGAAVLVYPGGDHESFRPSWHSGAIEFGGRSGFVRLALGEDVPIVPVVAIGGQETALFLTRGRRAARLLQLDRLLRLKVLPIQLAPPFGITVLDLPGRIPLPSQITVQVLPPLDLRRRFGDSPDEREVYDELTATMQEALDELSAERDLPIVGAVGRDGGGEGDAEPGDRSPWEPPEPRVRRPPGRPPGRAAGRGRRAGERARRRARDRTPFRGGQARAPAAAEAAASRRAGGAPPGGEDVRVAASTADHGAEDGPGPELRVEPPWEGYDRMRVRDIADRLAAESEAALAAVRLYEQTHRRRQGVLAAVERERRRR